MEKDSIYALFPTYQREMRTLLTRLTDQTRYDDHTKTIVRLLEADQTNDALLAVLQLRSDLQSFARTTQRIFNELLAAEAQTFLKYVELRQQTFAAIQEIAAATGDRDNAAHAAQELDRMMEYFAAAITDLDFEPTRLI